MDWLALAPLVKWIAIGAATVGGVALVLRSARKRGEASARAEAAGSRLEARREAADAESRSRSSGRSAADKSRRMRERVR